MIPFDFEYYRPDSIEEAQETFWRLDAQGKQPLYYGGGTEIISMARTSSIFTGAVIDLKAIPECRVLEIRGGDLVMGSAITLTQIAESKLFPLLGKTGGRIADRTIQGKITLGGNICGTIIYKETAVPILITDSQAVIATSEGLRKMPFNQVFDKRPLLKRGEFLVQVITESGYCILPYAHIKKTRNEKIDYPLVSVTALVKDKKVRLGFSGVCDFPFRSFQIEEIINDENGTKDNRINRVLVSLPASVLNDIQGTAAYREFVFRNTLEEILDWAGVG